MFLTIVRVADPRKFAILLLTPRKFALLTLVRVADQRKFAILLLPQENSHF